MNKQSLCSTLFITATLLVLIHSNSDVWELKDWKFKL